MRDIAPPSLMTLDNYMLRSDAEGAFEIIAGEAIPHMATVLGHGALVDNVMWALSQHIRPNGLGKLYPESPYVLLYQRDWVKDARIPDVMFIAAERLAAYQASEPDWARKPLLIVPDLVVEVVSPNDKYIDVNAKVKRYLADGVRLIWVIDPQAQEVNTRSAQGAQVLLLSDSALLDGGDVLPGFTVTLAVLFGV